MPAATWPAPGAGAVPAHQLTVASARLDPATGQPSAACELALVRAVCALLNSGGGQLQIGVDAGGAPVGIDAELASVDPPGRAGYEAWMLGMLTQQLTTQPELSVTVEEGEGRPFLVLTVVGADEQVRCRAFREGEPDELWVLLDERPARVSGAPPRRSPS